MSLDAIPAGSAVLLDSNILIYARRGMSEQCRRLLARCATGEIHGAITTIAVAEFCHRRMMQEAQSLGLAASNPAKALSQNPALLRQLQQYACDVEDVLAGELAVLALEPADLRTALELQRQHALLTNDSLHLTAARRAGMNLFATSDPNFDAVAGLTVFKPDDVK